MIDLDPRQQQDDEQHMMMLLAILQRVARGMSDKDDARMLASELGLTTYFKQEI